MNGLRLIALILHIEMPGGNVARIFMQRASVTGIPIKPSRRLENEIRRLNTAWRSKNFPQNNCCSRRIFGERKAYFR